jgi:hypothetical protein
MAILFGVLIALMALAAGWILEATARSWNMPLEEHEEVAHQQGSAFLWLLVLGAIALVILAIV